MHFHICPVEIAAFFSIIEHLPYYWHAFNYQLRGMLQWTA